jgi:hypothetical protein
LRVVGILDVARRGQRDGLMVLYFSNVVPGELLKKPGRLTRGEGGILRIVTMTDTEATTALIADNNLHGHHVGCDFAGAVEALGATVHVSALMGGAVVGH